MSWCLNEPLLKARLTHPLICLFQFSFDKAHETSVLFHVRDKHTGKKIDSSLSGNRSRSLFIIYSASKRLLWKEDILKNVLVALVVELNCMRAVFMKTTINVSWNWCIWFILDIPSLLKSFSSSVWWADWNLRCFYFIIFPFHELLTIKESNDLTHVKLSDSMICQWVELSFHFGYDHLDWYF